MSKKRIALIFSSLAGLFLLCACIFWCFFQNEDHRFSSFASSFFRQELSGNTLNLHYTLKDPSAFDMEDLPVSLGTYNSDAQGMCVSLENMLCQMDGFNRSRLSSDNRLTYDILYDSLSASLKTAPFLLYEEPLSPLTGMQSQLPILLSEYPFYDRQDVKDYLTLLTQVPDYFTSILAFEKEKADAGLLLPSFCIDTLAEECRAFRNTGDDCYLYDSFENRLEDLHLSEKEQCSVLEQHRQAMEESVFPAYSMLADGMSALKANAVNEKGLSGLPEGKEYYQALAAAETGSFRSVSELKELTVRQMNEDLTGIQKLYQDSEKDASPSPSSDRFRSQGYALADSNPASILTTLAGKLKDDFPSPPSVSVTVKYVQESLEEYVSPAFYMIPPIDDARENVIYINRGHMPDDLTLFTTLAHEGYPGHLYQTTYYQATDPHPVRSLLNYGGYTEGWATYAEMLSWYYAPIPKKDAALLQKNSSLILGLYALADIGIHYEGWSLPETVVFFQSYGITDVPVIRDIYERIVADPANYLKYYIGYVEFLELKKDAVRSWGKDFSQKRFHREVLETGPASFDLLRDYLL